MLDSIGALLRRAVCEQIVGDPIWAAIAIVGQITFAGRFIVQWIASERRRQSCIPRAFWWMSVVGSLFMLAYAIHLGNLILMAAFSLNMLIYVRNLHLIYRVPSVSTTSRSTGTFS